MTLLSLRNRPIHHDPSPAFKHSIKSPSIKPKSRFDCAIVWLELQTVEIAMCTGLTSPLNEYMARHQHGKRVGKVPGAGVMVEVLRLLSVNHWGWNIPKVRDQCIGEEMEDFGDMAKVSKRLDQDNLKNLEFLQIFPVI